MEAHLAATCLRAVSVRVDVADPDVVPALAGALDDEQARVDILVNHAAAHVNWAETYPRPAHHSRDC
jgi:NAD(P)-dependent dehydrogenase (short-subunit alcohol dehydrogenase family)